jgi:diacylglycerol kinase (ATP)
VPERFDVAVVANPEAGRGRVGRFLPSVLAELRSSGLSVGLVDRRDVNTAAAARAVVAAGGDGTVHLAAQLVAGTGVPLGVVPLGTGNDFADALGLAGDPGTAVRALITHLRAGASGTAVDAVRVRAARGARLPPHAAGHDFAVQNSAGAAGPAEQSFAGAAGPAVQSFAGAAEPAGHGRAEPAGPGVHWYVAILSVGFDSAVNARANRMRWPRGPRRYDLAIFAELLRMRSYPLELELDGVRVETPALLAAVGNTRSYGGGMRMCPAADPFDGLLDVSVVEPVSRYELVRVKPRLYSGTHITHPRVRTYRAKRITVAAVGAEAYVDGEPGRPLPLELECVPGALRVLGVNPPPSV